jgi:hypothetical protein
MNYNATIELFPETAERIQRALDNTERLDPGASIICTATFLNGMVMDVKCVGAESKDEGAWTEAVLMKPDENGNLAEVTGSRVSDDYLGEWQLEYKGDTYTVEVKVNPDKSTRDAYKGFAHQEPGVCADCGKPFPIQRETCGTGCGIYEGKKVCYACCAVRDRKALMGLKGREQYHLYLTRKGDGKFYVSNWPGTLKIAVDYAVEGRHNFAGCRTDVGFTLDGKKFYGTQYGNMSEICHVRAKKVA